MAEHFHDAKNFDPGHAPAGEMSSILLADGRVCHVRMMQPTDADAVRTFYRNLTPTSLYARFFGPPPPTLEQLVQDYCDADPQIRCALIAQDANAAGQVIADARYQRIGESDEGEFGIAVLDAYQGLWLGTGLLHRLIAQAQSNGLRFLSGLVMVDNIRMTRLLHRLDYPFQKTWEGVMQRFTLDLSAPRLGFQRRCSPA